MLTQDDNYAAFLLALDRSAAVNVSDWEAQFIESNLDRFSFSPKQRAIIDKLKTKYEQLIGWKDKV